MLLTTLQYGQSIYIVLVTVCIMPSKLREQFLLCIKQGTLSLLVLELKETKKRWDTLLCCCNHWSMMLQAKLAWWWLLTEVSAEDVCDSFPLFCVSYSGSIYACCRFVLYEVFWSTVIWLQNLYIHPAVDGPFIYMHVWNIENFDLPCCETDVWGHEWEVSVKQLLVNVAFTWPGPAGWRSWWIQPLLASLCYLATNNFEESASCSSQSVIVLC